MNRSQKQKEQIIKNLVPITCYTAEGLRGNNLSTGFWNETPYVKTKVPEKTGASVILDIMSGLIMIRIGHVLSHKAKVNHAGSILISEKPLTTYTAMQMMPKGFPLDGPIS